jgi:hypothetical protein
MSVRTRESGTEAREGGEDGEQPRRTVFRAVAVFDVSQTEGLPGTEPVSLESPSQPIEGDTHGHLLPALEELAGELGYSVARRPLDGPADGWCDGHKREIVINDDLPANAQVRILVHEIAHALGVGYSEYGRRRAEVLVDTVTSIVCGAAGLDTSGSSVPYVAGWGEVGELDAIRGYAETIDQITRRIEESIREESHDPQLKASLAASRFSAAFPKWLVVVARDTELQADVRASRQETGLSLRRLKGACHRTTRGWLHSH